MSLLQMSLTGAGMILLTALLRLLLRRRLPRRVWLLLWGLALMRLLLPFPRLFTLPVDLPGSAGEPVRAAPLALAAELPEPPAPAPGYPGALSASPASKTELRESRAALPPLIPVWLAGCALSALGFALLYLHGLRRFRRARPLDGAAARAWLSRHPLRRPLGLRALPGLDAPMTYGVLRPVILLPEGLDPGRPEVEYALEHEYVHVLRLDAAWKLLAGLALCLHWFNPAVWLLYLLLNRDLELSCDEGVLGRLEGDRRQAYASALVALEERRHFARSLSFSGGELTERVRAILRYRRPGRMHRALAAGLLLCLGVCALGGVSAGASLAGRRLYRNGGLTLSVPEELAEDLIVEAPEGSGGSVVFRVLERESWEAGQRLHPGEDRSDGWLFSILLAEEETAWQWETAASVSCQPLAREGRERFYRLLVPTDCRLVSDAVAGTDTRSARYARWTRVSAWARGIGEELSRANPRLLVYRDAGYSLNRCLAPLLYGLGSGFTLRQSPEGAKAPVSLGEHDTEALWDLVWNSSAQPLLSNSFLPEGEPLELRQGDSTTSLLFWPGSDLFAMVYRVSEESPIRSGFALAPLEGSRGSLGDILLEVCAAPAG